MVPCANFSSLKHIALQPKNCPVFTVAVLHVWCFFQHMYYHYDILNCILRVQCLFWGYLWFIAPSKRQLCVFVCLLLFCTVIES